jgi:hypothetical protein
MKSENAKLLAQAQIAKHQYQFGRITKAQALEQVKPFQELFNKVSIREAKKAGVRARLFNVHSFLR